MPNIMYTKNGQGPFPLPSTGMFSSIKTSSANSPQEALNKIKQQLPKIAPGFNVKNGLMDVKMKGNVYIVDTQNGGRKSRRNKRKTKSRRRKTRRH
jgi:hypothetical protein